LFLSYYVVSFTSRGTLVHVYFSSLPIDLRVVVLEPGIAEDYALLSETGDSEECPFRVGLVTENYIYYFRDLTCFVRGAVYIVHRYGARDAPGANTFYMDKVFVYKAAYSSRVQKRLDRVHLTGVNSTDLDRKDDGHSAGIKGVGRELFGESLLLFQPSR